MVEVVKAINFFYDVILFEIDVFMITTTAAAAMWEVRIENDDNGEWMGVEEVFLMTTRLIRRYCMYCTVHGTTNDKLQS